MIMKTKIIATIGPSTLEFPVFKKLVDEGIDIVRINTAYSNEEQHSIIRENIKKTKTEEKEIEIMMDIRSKETLEKVDFKDCQMIAVSFSESSNQLKEIKKIAPTKKIVAKIESEKGVENFNEIMKESWGVMVARGDLGRAVNLEKVPCLQKIFSKESLGNGKFLIVATEMLLSMTKNPAPTRAEVSDVANAVFDNASAVMLSEETAIGEYPVEAVRYEKNSGSYRRVYK